MIIFDRDGSTTFCGSVCGEGLKTSLMSQTGLPGLFVQPTQKQSVLPKPVLDFQQEPINKNIIDIIKKIRERLTKGPQQSSLGKQSLATKQGFENI